MTILTFDRSRRAQPEAAPSTWRPNEMAELMRLYAALRGDKAAVDYEFGETERGDPQFYVLGSDDDNPCLVVATRLAQNGTPWYVVEDGCGGVLFEGETLQPLIDAAACRWRAAGRGRLALILSALLGVLGIEMGSDDEGGSELTMTVAAAALDGSALAESLLRWAPQLAAAA